MNWREKKQLLVEQKRLDPVFALSADENALNAMRTRIERLKAAPIRYEPLLFEAWLHDIAQLADRVLAYRREARELEILAFKAQMDHELGALLADLERETQTLLIAKSVKQRAKLTQDTAGRAFEKQGPLQAGFFEAAAGRSDELSIELADADAQLLLVDKKWKIQREFRELLWSKNIDDGNAHNYAQRAKRVYELAGEDLAEAYQKALAVRVGVESVHQKLLTDIPPMEASTFVDAFVLWIRASIRWVEWVSQYKVEYDLVLPLTQPWAGGHLPILSPKTLSEALDKAKGDKTKPVSLEFDLTEAAFVGKKPARLIGVGLSYGNQVNILTNIGIDKNATADSYARLRAIVTTPIQQDKSGSYHRPQLKFGSVSVFGGSAPQAFEKGDSISNVSPIGKWSIELYPSLVYKDGSERNIGDGIDDKRILDLKLHLRVQIWDRPRLG